MKILITGAGGFIGSHLCEKLFEHGYSVKAFVHYNSFGSWGWLNTSIYKEEIEIVSGDIRDFDSVKSAVKKVDAVCHLAALIGIPYSYKSPLAYIKTNVQGTYNVLQACLELGVNRIIHTSTSEVYGTARQVPIKEDHPLQPQSPYSASKIAADQLCLSYYYSFDLPVVIARPFNTYGPRQSTRAVIPTIIAQLMDQDTDAIIKLGNLTPTRDLNFVKDTVSAYVSLIEADLSDVAGKVLNIGSGREISIYDLAHVIARLMGKKLQIIEEDERKRKTGSEVERLLCDSSLIRETTGWKPKFSLEEGLSITISWFKKNFHIYDSSRYHI